MVNPTILAAKSFLNLQQFAYDLLAAGQTVDEVGSPIGVWGKPTEEEVDCPKVDDRCMRLEERLQCLSTIEVKRQYVFGAVFQSELQLAATAVLVIFAHLFSADDAASGRAGKSAHR